MDANNDNNFVRDDRPIMDHCIFQFNQDKIEEGDYTNTRKELNSVRYWEYFFILVSSFLLLCLILDLVNH